MNGFDIKLLSQRTGISENIIKQILKRKPELQEKPYSIRSGGSRIFFPAFVDWLKKYYKVSEVSSGDPFDTSSKKLPSGAQLRELRLMAEKEILSKEQIHRMLGLEADIVSHKTPMKKPIALPEPKFSKDQKRAMAIGFNVMAKQERKIEDDSKLQNKLFDD